MARKIGLFLLALVLVAALVGLTPSPKTCNWDFRTNLWGPANHLVQNQAVYTKDTTYGPYPSVWMPMGIGAFFWLGWLHCTTAAKFWLLLELVSPLVIFWLLSGRKLPKPGLFLAGLLAIFLFPPFYNHLIFGQFAMFFCLLICLVVFMPGGDRWSLSWWAPVLVALGMTKPQLVILAYPGLLVSVFREQGWKGLIRFALFTALCAALLTAPLFIANPGWWHGFLWISVENLMTANWEFPSLYVLLISRLGLETGRLIWFVIFLAGFAASMWLWLRRDARTALVWSLALTPLVTPYGWSWDFVLLIPCLLWLILKLNSAPARSALLLGAFIIAVGQVALRWGADVSDQVFWWVPPALMLVFLLSAGLNRLVETRRTAHQPASQASAR